MDKGDFHGAARLIGKPVGDLAQNVAPAGKIRAVRAGFALPKTPTLPLFKKGGKTSGVLRTANGDISLKSGKAGPAQSIPKGTAGFDAYTRTHVEGHAAALMRQHGIKEATVYINNPVICPNCNKLLERMLPSGSKLHVVLPDGSTHTFTGR